MNSSFHPFNHSFNRSFVHSFIHLFIHSFTCSLFHSSTHLSVHSAPWNSTCETAKVFLPDRCHPPPTCVRLLPPPEPPELLDPAEVPRPIQPGQPFPDLPHGERKSGAPCSSTLLRVHQVSAWLLHFPSARRSRLECFGRGFRHQRRSPFVFLLLAVFLQSADAIGQLSEPPLRDRWRSGQCRSRRSPLHSTATRRQQR